MNALLTSKIISSGEAALTVSPKIRLIDEKSSSTANRLPILMHLPPIFVSHFLVFQDSH